MDVEVGTGKEIGGRRNVNSTMDVRNIRGTTKDGELTKKVQERRLKWYGHVTIREEHYVEKRAMEMKVQGGGREEDLREVGWTK